MDKRIARTRQQLRESLVALTLAHGYEAVTIREITARAGVGYATFFRHYADKDALLLDVLDALIDEMRDMLGQGEALPSAETEGRLIFEHVHANSRLYRVLLDGGSQDILARIQQQAMQDVLARFPLAPDGPVPPQLAAHQMVSGVIALIGWWLRNEMPYPPDEMGVLYDTLIIRPMLAWHTA